MTKITASALVSITLDYGNTSLCSRPEYRAIVTEKLLDSVVGAVFVSDSLIVREDQ